MSAVPNEKSIGYPPSILKNVPEPYLPGSYPEQPGNVNGYPSDPITKQPYLPSPPGSEPTEEVYKPSFTKEEKCCIGVMCCDCCVHSCLTVLVDVFR
ncbi:hypothetical protein L3Y34_009409 [Caenorhabditis briggsae]|uniref:Uncharacterized protein n=1 Tax=Caenorhabditis briggsae TaxID=6238 RepID=A0AAE9D1I9_CAEBR|nr:hypothetical protein L3Y34_009409 [Caenorhabditis briggsae]